MDINARLEIVLAPEVTALLTRIADALTAARFEVNSTDDAVAALKGLRASADAGPAAVVHTPQPSPAPANPTTEQPTTRRRRGRPPGTGKTADEQAQALEQQVHSEQTPAPAQPAAVAAPAGAIPPGIAVPPGMAVPPGAAAPVQPAMPNGAQHAVEGDAASLDDLRACVVAANQKNNKTAFKVLRAKTWADGTPKDTWFTIESVPAELRERVIEEMSQSLL